MLKRLSEEEGPIVKNLIGGYSSISQIIHAWIAENRTQLF